MNSKDKSISVLPTTPFRRLEDAHGTIPYGMTNDYMFRAVLQSNNKVLRGLICSLLHLSESEIISTEITNPIILGQSIEDKEFRLDMTILSTVRTIRRRCLLYISDFWIIPCLKNVRNFMPHIN